MGKSGFIGGNQGNRADYDFYPTPPYAVLTKNIRADNIITNPPFKSAQKFIEKALTIATKKVVILQRLAFLESKERYKLFTTTPLKCIYVFSKRLNFYPNGINDKKKSGMLAFAWFVWEQGYNKKTYINWIKGD